VNHHSEIAALTVLAVFRSTSALAADAGWIDLIGGGEPDVWRGRCSTAR